MKIYGKRTSISKSVLGICAGLILLVSAFSGSLPTASAQDAPDELFSDTLRGTPQLDLSIENYVSRSRFVSVNLDLLLDENGKTRSVEQLPEVTLNIFADASYTGKVEKVQKVAGSTSWSGSLAEVEGGYFYLVVTEGVFIAHVASTEGVYEISSVGDGVYQAIQIDQSKFIDDYPGELDEPGPVLSAGDLGEKADSSSPIDVMVVYTSAALAGEGGILSALKARIALAVVETNTSYANAGITTRLRLVHVEKVTYTETGNIGADVNRLAGTSDGYMDVVHSLRNTYGADMVSLIVENGGQYCGVATSIMANASNPFQVTVRNGCMTGYYSFGHEFGHLQGARHDVYVDDNTTPYAYGHGYVHTGKSVLTRWRTVMAYNNKCVSLGYNCTRLQYWSNPAKYYYSQAMGNTTAKNYLVLNNTDYTVANFRQAVIGSDFSSTFTSSSSGWAAVKGSWALASSNYYRSSGLASTAASAMYAGKYGDLTYTVRMYRTGACTTCPNRIIIRGNPYSLVATNSWKPSYYFQYANNGQFSIYYRTSAGTETALKAWTASTAIVKNGWNTLKVVAVGSFMKFYINDVLVSAVINTALSTGYVGVGFYRDINPGLLYVTSATLSTTPTSDVNLNADVMAGEELSGGTIDMAP